MHFKLVYIQYQLIKGMWLPSMNSLWWCLLIKLLISQSYVNTIILCSEQNWDYENPINAAYKAILLTGEDIG